MGHRPDKETTSPETSLLPSSDGFRNPVHFPGMGVKTRKSSGRSLDRSVSAPLLGSPRPPPTETVGPRPARSVGSLPEHPAALGREELPLSGRSAFSRVDTSLAGTEWPRRPNSPPLNTHAQPVASGSPKPSRAQGRGPGLASPVEEAEGSRLPCARTRAGDTAVPLSQTGPQPPEELGMEQSPGEQPQTARPQENSCARPAPPSPAKGGLARDYFLSEGSQAKDSQLMLPWEEAEEEEGALRPDSAPHKPPGKETLMEVEVTGQALTAADNRLKERNGSLSARGDPACSVMEAESSRSDSLLPADPLSASDLKQSGRMFESPDIPAAAGFSGPPPPPPEGQLSRLAEEASPSLASALKELHQLLLASYKKASRNESLDQPGGTLPDEKTADEIFEGRQQERRDRDIQDAELSSPEGTAECARRDTSAGVQVSGAGAEDGQETRESPGKGELIIEEPLDLDLSDSVVLRPSVASCEPPGGEYSGESPPCSPSDPTAGNEALGQNQPPSGLPQGGESRSVLSFPPGDPGLPLSSSAGEPGARHICSPESSPAAPRPPGFPSVDMEQIVRAGFTPQEASEALERAGGAVELALLILLAKKIVVPP